MRTRDILICSFCLVLAVALFIAAGTRLDYINSKRQELKLTANTPLENAPPSLAFASVALGAFRGLVVDVLWIRADKLKDEGQFFDAKQLAEWITTLQPRFTDVWEFQAWNMAYNISAAIPATQPEERWRWVKNGFELLRDKGIPLNPKSITLYRELSRIFQNKIGFVSDDAHKYYKLQLAEAMAPLLGSADRQEYRQLAEAPVSWGQILKDKNISPLIEALKKADKVFVNANGDEFVRNYLSLRQKPDRFAPSAFKVIDNYRSTRELRAFDVFARAYQLRNEWKLEPVLMQQLNENYGPVDFSDPNNRLPLDWRIADCHAIYWAIKGLQTAGKKEFSIAETNTDRMVKNSLQNLFRYGKLFIYDADYQIDTPPSARRDYVPEKDVYLRPDLRMFDSYNKAEMAILDKYKNIEKQGTYESLQDGHRNMLKNAVLAFYQAGHRKQAAEIYSQLRQLYPLEEFKVPLNVYVKNRMREELKTLTLFDAMEMVQLMLRESYFRYAIRDDDESAGIEKMAEQVHQFYQESNPEETRIDLPKLKLLKYLALQDFLEDQQYPLTLRRSLLDRIKIEKPELYEQLKQQAEELQKQQLNEQQQK